MREKQLAPLHKDIDVLFVKCRAIIFAKYHWERSSIWMNTDMIKNKMCQA